VLETTASLVFLRPSSLVNSAILNAKLSVLRKYQVMVEVLGMKAEDVAGRSYLF